MVLKASLVNTPGSLAVLGLSFSVRFGRSRFARYISLLVVGFAFLSSDLTVRAQMATNDISIATNDTSTLGQFKSFLQSRPAIVRVTFDRQVLTPPPPGIPLPASITNNVQHYVEFGSDKKISKQ